MNNRQKQSEKALDRLESKYEKELIRNYQIALKEIRGKIADVYEKYDGNWVELQKYNRLTKLEKEIAQEIGKLTSKNAHTLKRGMMDVFEESFYRTAYILSTEVKSDLGFSMLNRKLVEESIANPLDRVGFLQRNRDNQYTLTRQLREQLTQGLVQGEAYGTTAKRIKERMDVGASKAMTIARTENHRVRNAARLEAMYEGVASGITLKKMWLSSVDDRTRESHQSIDGEQVDVDKPFDVGGESLMYPGDPSGSAENVINCRCTQIEVVNGFEPNTRRVKGVGITEYSNFNDFKDKLK